MQWESWEASRGPQTDDELHAYVLDHYGVDIPRVAVCQGHQAPFTFFADAYFERQMSMIAMANRGGAKTWLAALWCWLSAKFKPECETASVASEQQTMRAYDHLKHVICVDAGVPNVEAHPDVEASVMRKTTLKNGSKYEIIIATVPGVNGPHPQKVHADEVEIMDRTVFEESRNMSQTKHGIRAQDVLTSTRKWAHGFMQHLIDQVTEAERKGVRPPYKLYTWCVFECAKQCNDCQHTNPDKTPCDCPDIEDCRSTETHSCPCHRISKGFWESGEPRRFSDECQGRLARSSGWQPRYDIWKNFTTLSQDVWEAQQTCQKPSTAGLVLPMFQRDRHCIRWYDPIPDNGPIYMSVDFGGTNPHAVEWVQILNKDVDCYAYHQSSGELPKKRIKEGTHVVFDEIYQAEIGNGDLAAQVVQREQDWRRVHPQFTVQLRFYDVQAKAASLDWARYSPPLVLRNFATKDVKEHVKNLKGLFNEDLMVVDISRCPMAVDELEAWHFPDKNLNKVDDPDKPVEDFDHTISAIRYLAANLKILKRKQQEQQVRPSGSGSPWQSSGAQGSGVGTGPVRYLPPGERPSQMGTPIPMPRIGWEDNN